jgi:hypothetical protein
MHFTPKKITVDDHKEILQLQEEFNQVFPYLKLELLLALNKQSQGGTTRFFIENNKTFELYKIHATNEKIIITPETTVAELEEKFKETYGLKAQVLRKSGKVWLETTITDVWTLEEQNLQGEALSKNVN